MAYATIPTGPFLLGLAVVAAPAVILEGENQRWAMWYAGLILLMFGVFHWQGLMQASAFVQRELQRKG